MTPTAPPGWEDILDPGEEILWQGRPEARFDWTRILSFRLIAGLPFTGFALLWICMASGAGIGLPFPVNLIFIAFGLTVLFIGLTLCFGAPLGRWLRLRGSFYTLTDRHAFIATEILGRRRLQRFALNSGLHPALEEGLPGSVWFATRSWDVVSLTRGSLIGFVHSIGIFGEKIGFEQIPESRTVYRLLLDAISGPGDITGGTR